MFILVIIIALIIILTVLNTLNFMIMLRSACLRLKNKNLYNCKGLLKKQPLFKAESLAMQGS